MRADGRVQTRSHPLKEKSQKPYSRWITSKTSTSLRSPTPLYLTQPSYQLQILSLTIRKLRKRKMKRKKRIRMINGLEAVAGVATRGADIKVIGKEAIQRKGVAMTIIEGATITIGEDMITIEEDMITTGVDMTIIEEDMITIEVAMIITEEDMKTTTEVDMKPVTEVDMTTIEVAIRAIEVAMIIKEVAMTINNTIEVAITTRVVRIDPELNRISSIISKEETK